MPLDPASPRPARAVEALRRRGIDHTPFSNGPIKLSLGRNTATGKIQHIAGVLRGRDCACTCPACGATLIARQGSMLSWHFAHASGDTCANALDVALLEWLMQAMQDGAILTLPGSRTQWGQTVISGPPFLRRIAADGPPRNEPDPGWHLPARGPEGEAVAIEIKTRPHHPSRDASPDRVRLVIDMHAAFTRSEDTSEDRITDPDWIAEQLLSGAPRRWDPEDPHGRIRDTLRETRIGAYLSARAELPKPDDAAVRNIVLTSPLGDALRNVEGAITDGLSGDWAAVLLHNLCLYPARPGLPCETGFGVEDAARILTATRRAAPALFGPNGPSSEYDADDRIEMTNARRPYPDPRQDILRMFEALWGRYILLRRIDTHRWTGTAPGPIAPLSDSHVGRDWQILPELHERLRQAV